MKKHNSKVKMEDIKSTEEFSKENNLTQEENLVKQNIVEENNIPEEDFIDENEDIVDEQLENNDEDNLDRNITNEYEKNLIEKDKKIDEYLKAAQTVAADFENYKRRSQKERQGLYLSSIAETVEVFIPILDNMERAISSAESNSNFDSLKEGIELVLKQFKDTLEKLEVKSIESVGNEFDPNIHNAVMHVEDDSVGANMVIEELQKGYIIKDKVIRHSMVKVAN